MQLALITRLSELPYMIKEQLSKRMSESQKVPTLQWYPDGYVCRW